MAVVEDAFGWQVQLPSPSARHPSIGPADDELSALRAILQRKQEQSPSNPKYTADAAELVQAQPSAAGGERPRAGSAGSTCPERLCARCRRGERTHDQDRTDTESVAEI